MTDRPKRRDILLGTGAAGFTLLAGCSGGGGDGGDSTPEPTEEPTEGDGGGGDTTESPTEGGGMDSFEAGVGVLMPETGDLGSLGTQIRDGALLAATMVNDADVSVSINTQVEDTQTDPQAGISGAEALVNAGFGGVVGPAASNVNLPVSQEVFIPNAVVGMSPSSTALSVTNLEDNDYVFRTAPSDALQGPVLAQVAAQRLEATTASTLFLNDAYGQALEDAFVSGFEEQGGEIANAVSFEPGQSSYSTQWSEALNADPDVVLVIGFPQSGIQIFRDYYSDFAGDSDVDILVTDGLIDNNLPEEVDNDMANVSGTAPATAGPGLEAFNAAYEEEYGRAPGVFNAHAFDAMAILALAATYGGGNDGQTIRDNIRNVANPDGTEVGPDSLTDAFEMALAGENINYQGASSTTNFDDAGDITSAAYTLFEVEERDFASVDTVSLDG